MEQAPEHRRTQVAQRFAQLGSTVALVVASGSHLELRRPLPHAAIGRSGAV